MLLFIAFILGVYVGLSVIALFTSSKVSDLHATIEACHINIRRLEEKLKAKEESKSHYPKIGCTFDE
jgi:hypothetical protein